MFWFVSRLYPHISSLFTSLSLDDEVLNEWTHVVAHKQAEKQVNKKNKKMQKRMKTLFWCILQETPHNDHVLSR